MSSEMRELVKDLLRTEMTQWSHAFARDKEIAQLALTTFCAKLDATLLARTEAGADAVGVLTVRRWRGIDAMVNHEFEYLGDLPDGTYSLFTHPQDASGDAERFAFLASKAKQDRAYDVFGAGGHWGIGIHSDDGNLTFREAVDAAMQAKEAK